MGNKLTSTITITWHALPDACKICAALNGYTWIFEVGTDVLTDALIHPVYGIVWSLEQGSNAHAHGYLSGQTNSCRCTIEPHINLEDILAKCTFLKETIQTITNETEPSTTLEDIGIIE